MNKLDILISTILLMYRESLLDNKDHNNIDLVYKILDTMEDIKRFNIGGGHEDIYENIKEFIREMLKKVGDDSFDKSMLIQSMSIILKEDEKALEIFKDGLDDTTNEDNIKRVNRLVRFLSNYYKEIQLKKLLNSVSYRVSNQRGTIKNIKEFIDNIKMDLDSLDIDENKSIDPAIIDEIDFHDNDAMDSLVDKIKNENDFGSVLKFGWQDLNTMTQGKRIISYVHAA